MILHAPPSPRTALSAWPTVHLAVLLVAPVLLALALPTGARAQALPTADALQADRELLQRAEASRGIGGGSAAVTIVEFFDPACSTCRNFHRQRGDSLTALAGPDVRIEYRTYLIPRLVRGWHGAEAAACAAGLGGFDAFQGMNDRLMEAWDTWGQAPAPAELFVTWARSLGLDADRFADCLARDVTASLLVADILLAGGFAVSGTPTFVFVPRGATSPREVESFYGNEPMQRFHEVLAAARSRAR
jgi:protein-disulfide isomerase